MEKLTKEEEIIEFLEKIYDLEIEYHHKIHEYFNEMFDKENFLLGSEYKFQQIADMCCNVNAICNALSLMRNISNKIKQEREKVK